MDVTELVGVVRQGLAEDERIAREACGSTKVGEIGNWRQAPGGDEWVAVDDDGDQELLVALRPGLPRPPDVMAGYWGAVVSTQADERERGVRGPMDAFRHTARHDPRRVLAEVTGKRQLLDDVLGWRHDVHDDSWFTCQAATDEHDGGTYAETDGGGPCTCGRDARVLAVLTHLAAPYQESP